MDGQKIPLGFVESATENERICRQLIQDLIRRGLCYDQGLLVVLDGSKGLRSAVTKALKGYVRVHRCQWHKRENVVSYLPERERPRIRRKLQKAYDCDTYEEAKAALESLKPELKLMNQSAVTSLEEGLETLTLHRLGMLPFLKRSFRTTNCIEALNSMTGELTRKVNRWNNSPQRHRWVAAALLDIEPRLRRVSGYKHLPLLRQALNKDLNLDNEQNAQKRA